MNDMVKIRDRFLKDDIPTRLGSLASNLRRIKSFSSLDVNQEVVKGLLDESKYFIEWTAAETEINTAGELVELQILLARVTFNLNRIWCEKNRRKKLAEQALQWSDRVLELSGLLS